MQQLTIQTDVTKSDLNHAIFNYEQRLIENARLLESQKRSNRHKSIIYWLGTLLKAVILILTLTEILLCVFAIMYEPQSTLLFLVITGVSIVITSSVFWMDKKFDRNPLQKYPHTLGQEFFIKSNASRFRKSTFKNFDNQPLPFTAIYEFVSNKITYYRAFNNQKKLILAKNFNVRHYDTFDGVVILYTSKWITFPRLMVFVTPNNLPILLDYLQELGAKPIKNTDENTPNNS